MSANPEFLDQTSDEKLRVLLSALETGESRESLAMRLGYRHVKSLDSFLRRRGYIWDRYQQSYVKKPSEQASSKGLPVQPPDLVARVLTLWEKPNADAKEIAKQTGFSDHQKMGRYMESHGYVWSANTKTYVRSSSTDAPKQTSNAEAVTVPPMPTEATWQSYGSLLSWLSQHQNVLQSIVSVSNDPKFLPRYIVPGVLVTKSVHMSHLLDQLARDYSREKHVSQREIFEVALTEFFQRHGYHNEIKRLFKGT